MILRKYALSQKEDELEVIRIKFRNNHDEAIIDQVPTAGKFLLTSLCELQAREISF